MVVASLPTTPTIYLSFFLLLPNLLTLNCCCWRGDMKSHRATVATSVRLECKWLLFCSFAWDWLAWVTFRREEEEDEEEVKDTDTSTLGAVSLYLLCRCNSATILLSQRASGICHWKRGKKDGRYEGPLACEEAERDNNNCSSGLSLSCEKRRAQAVAVLLFIIASYTS